MKIRDAIRNIGKEPWTPIVLAKINNHILRIAYFKGNYHWHKHNTEELFLVHHGSIKILFKDRKDVVLNEGEFFVVPKNVLHCTSSKKGAYVLFLETADTNVIGD